MVEVSKAFIVKSATRDTFVQTCAMEVGSELPALGDPVTGDYFQMSWSNILFLLFRP